MTSPLPPLDGIPVAIAEAQAQVDGSLVARIIMDFHRTFNGVYSNHVMTSSLCAVGPLQSMIGLAIKNGRIAAPGAKDELTADKAEIAYLTKSREEAITAEMHRQDMYLAEKARAEASEARCAALMAERDGLRKAIRSFSKSDTELQRAEVTAEQPRLSKAGTRYAIAKSRMFRTLEAQGADSMSAVEAWRPIETVPRDGTVVECYFPLEGLDDFWDRHKAVFWNGSRWVWAGRAVRGYSDCYQPSKWRPVSEPSP